MHLHERNTTVISPKNDGESVAICDIAQRCSFDLRISEQKWGATLEKEFEVWPGTFKNLKKNVVIVEIPGPQKEAVMKEDKRCNLFIIDHHSYPSLNRAHVYSSLEQFAQLAGYRLSRFEMGVAINDRSFIGALLDRGYSKEETEEIRRYDLEAQGYKEEDFIKMRKVYATGKEEHGCYVVQTTYERSSYLSDIHYWANGERNLDLLIFKPGKDGAAASLSYSGGPETARLLYEKVGGYAGGDEAYSMYWGKVVKSEEELNLFFNRLHGYEKSTHDAHLRNVLQIIIQNLPPKGGEID